MKHGRCSVCDIGQGYAFYCPDCINGSFFQISSKKTRLKELTARCEALKTRCKEQLGLSQKYVKQYITQKRKEEKLKQLSSQVQKLRAVVWEKQKEVEQIQKKNEQRKQQLMAANQKMQNCVKEMQQLEVQQRISFWETLEVQSKVIQVQKERLLQLSALFPLRISAFQQKTGIPVQVTIRNLPLPDPVNPTIDMFNRPEELNAALGYVLHFIDIHCKILGVCKLHYHRFCGSRSIVFSPRDLRVLQSSLLWSKSKEPIICPMYIESYQLLRSRQQHMQQMSLLSFSQTSQQLDVLSQSTLPKRNNQFKGLALGLAQLYNTIVCIAQSSPQISNMEDALPANWSPFAWLQVIVQESIDCQIHEVLRPKSEYHVMSDLWLQNLSEMLVEEDDGTTQQIDDGWDVVKVPMVPRPSSPADVEQWARAMFVDAQKTSQVSCSNSNSNSTSNPAAATYQSLREMLGQRGSSFVESMKRLHDTIKHS